MQLMGKKALQRTRCSDARALLPEYVEGELGAVDHERVAGHLQMCPECRQEERQFHKALAPLAGAPRVMAPADLYRGFAAKLDERERIWHRRAVTFRLAGAAACLLVVIGVGAAPLIQRIMSWVEQPVDIPQKNSSVAARPNANAPQIRVTQKPPVYREPDARESKIVEPAPSEQAPTPLRTYRTDRTDKSEIPRSFLDVAEQRGVTARQQFTEKAAGPEAVHYGRKPQAYVKAENGLSIVVSRGTDFIPERDERIQVGDNVTTIKTGYKLDEGGKRRVVKVNIDATTVTE